MDLISTMKISSSALEANRVRQAVISSNIANAQVTRTVEGTPYRPKQVVFGAAPVEETIGDALEKELEVKPQVVEAQVVTSDLPPILKYEPNNPEANEQGYVAYPNINVMEEMANMIETSRSYEANVNVMNTTKNMLMKDLEIGKN